VDKATATPAADATGADQQTAADTTKAADAAAAATGTPDAPLPVTWAEYRGAAALLGFFVLNFALALLVAGPAKKAGLEAFENPDNVGNSLLYLVMILVFTFIILAIAKWGKKGIIQAIILGAVGVTVAYVAYPLLAFVANLSLDVALGGSIVIAVASVVLLYKHPEWYVIDAVGLMVAAGAAAIFGISLGIVPVIVLLAALAIYDAIAVYRTRHMLSLADTVIELRLPVLLVIPKHWNYSFLKEASKFKEAKPENKGEREAMFMGLGDLVMPTILVVSALQFGAADWGIAPVLGAAVGTLVGYGVLMGFVLKGNPQAGLPLLNGGAIVGFLSGVYAASGSIVFW
jgi:presenilin-like A22 family membrane protease